MVKNHYFLPAFILAFSAILFLSLVFLFWPFTIDDTFITLRYADNLASGYGPTYNPGLPPVEGYTTFLWMIILTIPHLLNLDAVLFAKLVGIIATIGYLAVSFKYVIRLTSFLDNRWKYVPAAICVLSLVSTPGTTLHAVSGMETALFTLFTTSFLYLAFVFVQQPERTESILLALNALLLGLTRPEGNLVAGVGLFCIFLALSRQQLRILFTTVAFLYLFPGGIYFLWRATYYGQLLPLPFYLKVSSQPFLGGTYIVAQFVTYIIIHFGVLILYSFYKTNFRLLLPSVLPVIAILVFFIFPTHIMGYEWRYLFPIVPFVSTMAALGTGVLLFWLWSLDSHLIKKKYVYCATISLGICALIVAGFSLDIAKNVKGWRQYANGLSNAHIALGKYLNAFDSSGQIFSLAIGDAGAVPYYSKWRTIDTYGLNEARIALSGQHDAGYVLSQNPDLLVLISSDQAAFHSPLAWENDLYEMALHRNMALTKILVFREGEYYLWILTNPNTQLASYIEGWK